MPAVNFMNRVMLMIENVVPISLTENFHIIFNVSSADCSPFVVLFVICSSKVVNSYYHFPMRRGAIIY